jgi:WD40 repeat protein
LATGSTDGTARLWDVATHRQIGTPMTADDDYVRDVAFSPDGKILATASNDGTARLWSVATHQQIGASMTADSNYVKGVAFSPNGTLLVTTSDDDTVRLWDIATQQQVGPPMTPVDTSLARVAFSPKGTIFATGGGEAADGDASAQLWGVAFPRNLMGAVCAIAGDTSLSPTQWALDVPSEPFEQACP